MPAGPNSRNGLTRFSLHATEEASSAPLQRLQEERAAYPAFGLEAASPVDPETAARRYLAQALDSEATPSLSRPESGGTTSSFKTIDTQTVPLTRSRIVKFRQTLHEIPVYGSLVTVELDLDNELVGIDSTMGEPTGVDPVAQISPAQARTAAEEADDGYTPTLGDAVPKLHYYFDATADQWRLVYIIEDVPVVLDSDGSDSELEPPRYVDYVVDAHEGTVVKLLPRTPSMAAQQQEATDAFGDLRTFNASEEDGHLVLRDTEHNVETYDFGFQDPTTTPGLPGDLLANPPDWTAAAVSAHANAVAVSDFMHTVLMRNNIDDQGGAMISTINCVVLSASPGNNEWRNAFWSGQIRQMVYGQVLREDGALRTLAANVDVVAHEMFHGVTDSTSRLEYEFQSGALNESYSDIFGTIVANLGNDDTSTWDWLLGDRLLPGDRPFRDLSDPPAFDQPEHMDGFQDLPNTREGDWGGVHINSGIHNKAAFNLLTATDDDGAVLTPAEVSAVFYVALTQRLSRTSQFVDSRRAVVASARSFFRDHEDLERKVGAVEAAFDAVGILDEA